jgi:chemotaxis protein methyltransferase CheR
MRRAVFNRFCEIAQRHAGLEFSDAKLALITARVAKRVRVLGMRSDEEYIAFLEDSVDSDELVHFLDVVTTNYTTFFREPDHFELLSARLADWRAQGQKRFRIWCAAASTGEEPYTLAITVLEALEPRTSGIDVRILATDISTRVLETAVEGVYESSRLEPVPAALRKKYFAKNGDSWRINESARAVLIFKRVNLARVPFPMSGPLDAIFCRNVIMYLSHDVRQNLVREFERLIRRDGLVVVGHAESFTGLDMSLRIIKPSAYSMTKSSSMRATAR